jgi:hypothetical protein
LDVKLETLESTGTLNSTSWLGWMQFRLLGPLYRRSLLTRYMIAGSLPAVVRHHETIRSTYVAELRLTRVTLALVAFEAEHGRYPEALADLVPDYLSEVPSDPFAKGPLRYRPEEGGAVVYSVGGNLSDEDGKQKDDIYNEGDVVVRLGSAMKAEKDNTSTLGDEPPLPDAFQAVEPDKE